MSTTATAPTDTTALRWKHARGLGWMTWRQQRTALDGNRCQVPLGLFEQNYDSWAQYIPRFVLFVPGLLAAFVAAPILAREIESGTYRFAWTQSRSRSSWLASKVLLLIIPITIATVVFSALFTWWFNPFEPLMGRMSSGQAYEVSGTVFAARTAFGLALGLLVGAVLRRVVAAMAVTLAAWVATTWATIVYLRPTIEQPLDVPANSSLITRGDWTISEYFRSPDGVHITNKGSTFSRLYAQAQHDGVNGSQAFTAWLAGMDTFTTRPTSPNTDSGTSSSWSPRVTSS